MTFLTNWRGLILLLFFILIASDIFAQCELTAEVYVEELLCGQCTTLFAFGQGQGDEVFSEDFDSGTPTGWQFTQQATFTNPCDPAGVDGTTHLWMGDNSAVPRSLETFPYDFTTATAGATVCFDLLFAEQTGEPADAPCEGPDEPDEGVYLEYSTDGGATWVTINFFDPNGGFDPLLTNWNNWCFDVPAAALTANTQFRWFQDNDSGADYDHWGIDNVEIYFNDPTFEIIWEHDGYSYGVGNGGGENPNVVCPTETTTYTVNMSNGAESCTAQVTVVVVDPDVIADVTADPTSVCAGDCVTLEGTATVIESPAKQPTYFNGEIAPIVGFPSADDLVDLLLPCLDFGGCTCPNGSTVAFLETCPAIFDATIAMNINITDLNTTSLANGEITQVCIGDATLTGADMSAFEAVLICPDGTSITLASTGDLAGGSLIGACFDAVSSTPISAGSSPYTGNWQPVDPFSNLNGCDPNGVWTLEFTGTFDLGGGGLPFGALNGWDISFDDPEISYEGNYTWSPTTDMTGENTLTPEVCPTSNTTYTISVTDNAGCVVVTDDIAITIDPNCCPFYFDPTITQPGCDDDDGIIDMALVNGSGNVTYSWDTGPSTNLINGLGGGSYTLTVNDIGLGCTKDTTIVLDVGGPAVTASIDIFADPSLQLMWSLQL